MHRVALLNALLLYMHALCIHFFVCRAFEPTADEVNTFSYMALPRDLSQFFLRGRKATHHPLQRRLGISVILIERKFTARTHPAGSSSKLTIKAEYLSPNHANRLSPNFQNHSIYISLVKISHKWDKHIRRSLRAAQMIILCTCRARGS